VDRKVVYYKNYYLNFILKQSDEVRIKFAWTIDLFLLQDRLPSKYLKSIKGSKGLFEIRVQVGSNIFRVFAFFDKNDLVIIINGFQKKSNKTPINEIKRAESIKEEYYRNKQRIGE